MRKMRVEDVEVTLKLGQLLNKKQIKILRGYFIVSMIAVILLIVMFFMPGVEHDKEFNLSIIFASIIVFGALGIFIIPVWYKDKKIKKLVSLYLEDAIESTGHGSTVQRSSGCFHIPATTKICVKFKYNGKVLKRVSSAKNMGNPKGCSSVFNKYAESEFRILYTPKYDDVMILKDNISD